MQPTTLKITCWLAALGLSAPGLALSQRGGTEAAGKAADHRGPLRFERISVADPVMNGAEAVGFLAPAGWKSEGGIQWFPEHSVLANLLMRLSDPESGAAIEFLPVQNFTCSPTR